MVGGDGGEGGVVEVVWLKARAKRGARFGADRIK
jgi:hypothetical protein